MSQPEGFIDPTQPHHICRLHKALDGFKQALWACLRSCEVLYWIGAFKILLQILPFSLLPNMATCFFFWSILMTSLSLGKAQRMLLKLFKILIIDLL